MPDQASLFAFHAMAKPAGPDCNLACEYCFYRPKKALFPGRPCRMSEETQETYIRQYLAGQRANLAVCGWQGGEPTLAGLDFFRRAVALQEKHRRPGQRVENNLQTNGLLVDGEWARFLADNHFLVGLSLDGPPALNDRCRLDPAGRPSADRVLAALERLKSAGAAVNILCVVSRANADEPRAVYRFFRELELDHLQFIPAVDRRPDGEAAPWSVEPLQYGRFLAAVFDEWRRADRDRVFVQTFAVCRNTWAGRPASLCLFARACGLAPIVEHNGDVYACDHFVTPDHRLGNIGERPLAELVAGAKQRAFGAAKREKLPGQCRRCDWLFACQGGCPKNRFAATEEGETGLNYLCAGYRHFFRHADPHLRKMI